MIQDYIKYLRCNLNYSDNTTRAYRQDLTQFCQWAKPKGLRWSTIEKSDIDNWVSELHGVYQPKSIQRKVTAIRSLMRWAHVNGLLAANPARYVQSPKQAQRLPNVADKEALERYLSNEVTSYRSAVIHALIAVLIDTGIRLQEAIDIRTVDIDADAHSIRINGKGGKERIVYYTERMTTHCVRTCNMRSGYLLPVADQRELRYMMYAELKGYTVTHPHAIRHLWATEMVAHGASLQAVASLMGHSSVKTTERYTHISDEWLRSQYEEYIQ